MGPVHSFFFISILITAPCIDTLPKQNKAGNNVSVCDHQLFSRNKSRSSCTLSTYVERGSAGSLQRNLCRTVAWSCNHSPTAEIAGLLLQVPQPFCFFLFFFEGLTAPALRFIKQLRKWTATSATSPNLAALTSARKWSFAAPFRFR